MQSTIVSSPWGGLRGQGAAPLREDSSNQKAQGLTKAERRARAEVIKAQAQKSLPDKYGNVRCLSCGKVLSGYEALAGHLVSLHEGENSEERKRFEGAQFVETGAKRHPPVLLSEGLAPILERWPLLQNGGRSADTRALEGRSSESHGGLDQKAKGLEGRESQRLVEQPNAGKAKGHGEKSVTVNILANHAAENVNGESRRSDEQKRGDKKVQNPNTAQSTEFVERRGKEREQPKKKRVSKLKKMVLQERATRAEVSVTEEMLDGDQDRAKAVPDDVEKLSISDSSTDSMLINVASPDVHSNGFTRSNAVQPGKDSEIRSGKDSAQSCEPGDSGSGEVASSKQKHEPVTYVGPNVQIRYCRQVISTELNTTCFELLKELVRFQERVRAQDPSKLKMKKRLVTGFREVAKSVRTKRAKCLIVAPNIEETVEEGALDTSLSAILEGAQENGIEAVFALTRLRIAQAFGRRVRMSIVAILSFEGADRLYKKMLLLAAAGRSEWESVHT